MAARWELQFSLRDLAPAQQGTPGFTEESYLSPAFSRRRSQVTTARRNIKQILQRWQWARTSSKQQHSEGFYLSEVARQNNPQNLKTEVPLSKNLQLGYRGFRRSGSRFHWKNFRCDRCNGGRPYPAADINKLADFGTTLRRRGAPGGFCYGPCGGMPSGRFTMPKTQRPATDDSPATCRGAVAGCRRWSPLPKRRSWARLNFCDRRLGRRPSFHRNVDREFRRNYMFTMHVMSTLLLVCTLTSHFWI